MYKLWGTAFQNKHSTLYPYHQSVRVLLFASLPPIGIVSVLDSSHSKPCMVMSHCYNLHFLDDK